MTLLLYSNTVCNCCKTEILVDSRTSNTFSNPGEVFSVVLYSCFINLSSPLKKCSDENINFNLLLKCSLGASMSLSGSFKTSLTSSESRFGVSLAGKQSKRFLFTFSESFPPSYLDNRKFPLKSPKRFCMW